MARALRPFCARGISDGTRAISDDEEFQMEPVVSEPPLKKLKEGTAVAESSAPNLCRQWSRSRSASAHARCRESLLQYGPSENDLPDGVIIEKFFRGLEIKGAEKQRASQGLKLTRAEHHRALRYVDEICRGLRPLPGKHFPLFNIKVHRQDSV